MIKSQGILDVINGLVPAYNYLIPPIYVPPESPDPFVIELSLPPLLPYLKLTGHFIGDEIVIDPVDIPAMDLYTILETLLPGTGGSLSDALGINCLIYGTGTCTSDASCNDYNDYTADSCVAGRCQNTVIPGSDTRSCIFPSQCDDFDPCTTDTCVSLKCTHTSIPNCFGPPVADGSTSGLSACSFDLDVNASHLKVRQGKNGTHMCFNMNQGDLGACKVTFNLQATLNHR